MATHTLALPLDPAGALTQLAGMSDQGVDTRRMRAFPRDLPKGRA